MILERYSFANSFLPSFLLLYGPLLLFSFILYSAFFQSFSPFFLFSLIFFYSILPFIGPLVWLSGGRRSRLRHCLGDFCITPPLQLRVSHSDVYPAVSFIWTFYTLQCMFLESFVGVLLGIGCFYDSATIFSYC